MGYENEPSYGNEHINHKTVTVTFKTPLTVAQVENLFNNAPQLDEKFTDYGYTDGEKNGASFDHGWEKTDVVPRALISYDVNRSQIVVRGSDAVSTADFIEAARYILTEAAKIENAEVASIKAQGFLSSYKGETLQEAGDSLTAVTPRYTPPHKKRGSPQP